MSKNAMSLRSVLILSSAASAALATSARAQSTFAFPATITGTVTAPAISEASGLAASRDSTNVMWLENDGGHPNTIYAVNTAGQLLGSYTLTGTTNNDWEEISVGPGPVPGVNYLYLVEGSNGEVGRMYRIPEPAIYANSQASSPVTISLTGATTKKFQTPAPDAESLFVDPVDGNIYIGSKESGSTKFYMGTQAQFDAGGTTTTSTVVGSVPLSKGNGATISPDGKQIMVRNQNQFAILYNRAPGQSIASALAVTPAPSAYIAVNGKDVELNAEAIAFDAVGRDFYTFSEGTSQKLYKYGRTSNDAPIAPTTLLPASSSFKYISGGTTPAAGWTGTTFNEAGWSTGAGALGYGQAVQGAVISFGGNASNKAASAFFRTTFNVADADNFGSLILKLLVDDGAAVYLNGTEILRNNLVAGATPGTFAIAPLDDALQNSWQSFSISSDNLLTGLNTLAVEVHGASATDSDLRFDAQLVDKGLNPAIKWTSTGDGTWTTSSNWSAAAPVAAPSVAAFKGAITSNATITLASDVSVGKLIFENAARSYTVSGSGMLTVGSAGTPAVIDTRSGSHTIQTTLNLPASTTIKTGSGATLNVSGFIQAPTSTLTKTGAGTLAVAAADVAGLSVQAGTVAISGSVRTAALTVAGTPTSPTAKIDLGVGASLVVNYSSASPLGDVTNLIVAGRGTVVPAQSTFAYDGLGITSTASGARNALAGFNQFVVVAIENSALGVNAYTTFGGQSVDGTSVIVRATYAGDINLDGIIDSADYAIINAAFNEPSVTGGWASGDFNGDLIVNADDYAIIDFGALTQTGALSVSLPVAVPEPTTAMSLLVAMTLLTRRRRT